MGKFKLQSKYKPVGVLIGAGFIIRGLDKALMEMKVGEKKEIKVSPEDGFGNRDARLVKVFQKKMFENPQQGMVINVSGAIGRIQSVTAGRVRVDFNNPLAGKTLVYEVEIKEKIEKTEDKIKAVFNFFGAESVDIKIEGVAVRVEGAKLSVQAKEKTSKIIKDNIKIDEKSIEKISFVEDF